MKHPLSIAVLNGGPGSEREVSLRSGECVASALAARGHRVERIDVRNEQFALPADVDIAVIMLHGVFGEDGVIQSILDERGIPYTGENAEVSRIAFDKILSKQKFLEANVPTPAYEVIEGARPGLPFPYVVKAPREGSSVGIHIVKVEDQLEAALTDVARFGNDVLVEEFIAGRELTVGMIGERPLPIIEIVPKEGFYDFKNKYPWLNPQGAAQHFCPANLTEAEAALVQKTAVQASRALDLQVYGRVDLILPEDGIPRVLEINTIPGMTDSSLLPEAAGAVGIEFGPLCEQIIELSFAKHSCANTSPE